MKKINTHITTIIERLGASTKLQVILVGFIVSIFAATSVLADGPERPTFTSASPANYVTFNSITDNPEHGDERNSVLIREAGVGTYRNEIKIVPGKEYEVYSYFHNNAKSSLNPSKQGIATNTRMSVQAPSVVKPGERGILSTSISADNANPKKVWDEAYVTTDTTIDLRYVAASAKIHSGGAVNGSILPSSLFTTGGAFLGYFEMNGVMPGCADYAGYVVYRLKADKPGFEVAKDVSLSGKGAWADNIAAAPGAKVDYRITYKNTGTTDQMNVTVKDVLPAGMKYVPGSATAKNASQPSGVKVSDDVIGKGINIGHYHGGESGVVTFSATVARLDELQCGQLAMRNTVSVITSNGTKNDTADVLVNKEGCAPAALPTTGPAEVIAGLIGIAAITIGIVYYIKSRRDLDQTLHAAAHNNSVVKKTDEPKE